MRNESPMGQTDQLSALGGSSLAGRLTPHLLALILIGHALLGLVMHRLSALANVHCGGTVLLGIGAAVFSKKIAPVAWIMGYIVGAEVLWRMSNSTLPYEISKYTITLMSIIALVRLKHYVIPKIAVSYFLLLLPALAVSYGTLSGEALRAGISFNLSGPVSLFATVCFFANVTLFPEEWKLLPLAIITPLAGITMIAAHGTFSNPDIQFGTESMHDASGGFGPNQVSAMLGLGALLAVHYVLNSKDRRKQLIVLCVAAFFIMQAVLTFSRGGVVAAAMALAPAVFFKMRQSRERGRLVVWVAILVGFCGLVLYPLLDEYTAGALTARYTLQDLSGREELMHADFIIWEQNRIFGVGVGGSAFAHLALYGRAAATHNEFTRLLAEHGMFGLAAILLIAAMAVSAVLRTTTVQEKSYASSFVLWSILFSGASSMRIAAAGFMFGIAFVRLKHLYRRPERTTTPRRDELWAARG